MLPAHCLDHNSDRIPEGAVGVFGFHLADSASDTGDCRSYYCGRLVEEHSGNNLRPHHEAEAQPLRKLYFFASLRTKVNAVKKGSKQYERINAPPITCDSSIMYI